MVTKVGDAIHYLVGRTAQYEVCEAMELDNCCMTLEKNGY
jgi:hypothetical protein